MTYNTDELSPSNTRVAIFLIICFKDLPYKINQAAALYYKTVKFTFVICKLRVKV